MTGLLALAACAFSPLSHRVDVGHEAFVVFVGNGVDHNTDLFAVPASGGAVAQFTFTPLVESHPHLSPDGLVVAFLRARDTLAATPRHVVLMNLYSGGEQQLALPDTLGQPDNVAWSDHGNAVFVHTDRGIWQTPAPPMPIRITPISAADSAAADSALGHWLGSPRFARAVVCATGGVCAVGVHGDTAVLSTSGHDAIRWGSDSVGWFEGDALIVRSLGPGRERKLAWQNAPDDPRDGSYAAAPSDSAP